VMAATLLSYGALFAFLGVLLRRPVIPGLLFLFGWELLANLPGYLPRLTLNSYLRSLVHHRPAQEGLAGLFNQVQPVGLSLAVVFVTTALSLGAAAWLFSEKEYVLDQ
jgi:ABC-type transport system involved in multi-copper enzyme maturation permease subunit